MSLVLIVAGDDTAMAPVLSANETEYTENH